MGVLIFVLSLFLYFISHHEGLRKSVVKSLLTSVPFIVIVIEICSFFNCLIPWILQLFFIVLSILIFLNTKRTLNLIPSLKALFFLVRKSALLFSIIALIIIPQFFFGIIIAPNNWDTLTYHFGRIGYWLQHGNVSFYPTNDIAQIYSQPLAEYLQLSIMSGFPSDYAGFIVQFGAWLGCGVLGSLWLQKMGFSLKNQILGGSFTLLIPLGIMQSITGQNDLISAFFFFLTIYHLPPITPLSSHSIASLKWAALATACAALTKIISLVFLFPFWTFTLILFIIKQKTVQLKHLLILLPALLLLPYLARNIEATGKPLGSGEYQKIFLNENHKLGGMASSMLKHIGYQWVVPIAPINKMNHTLLYHLHQFIRVDLNDESYSMLPYVTNWRNNEDMQAGGILWWLAMGGILFLFFSAQPSRKQILQISGLLAMGLILYSVIFKFFPFSTRYFMSFSFPMQVIFFAIVANRFKPKIIQGMVWMFLLISLPSVYHNENRPIAPYSLVKYWIQEHFLILPKTIENQSVLAALATSMNEKEKDLFYKIYPNGKNRNVEIDISNEEKTNIMNVFSSLGLFKAESILLYSRLNQYTYPELFFNGNAIAQGDDYASLAAYVTHSGEKVLGIADHQFKDYIFRQSSEGRKLKLISVYHPPIQQNWRNASSSTTLKFIACNQPYHELPEKFIEETIQFGHLYLYKLKSSFTQSSLLIDSDIQRNQLYR